MALLAITRRKTKDQSWMSVDWRSPVNWSHKLNDGLYVWLLATPATGMWTGTWLNIAAPNWSFTGTNTENTDWSFGTGAERRGGWGCVDLGGTNEYFNLAVAPFVSYPHTLMCFGRLANVTATMSILNISNAGGDNYLSCGADGNNEYGFDNSVVADPSGPGSLVAGSSTDYAANAWHHFCAVFTSTTSRSAMLDGNGVGTDADTASAPSSWTRIMVGAFNVGASNFGPTTGQLDDVRVAARTWTQAEVQEYIEESKAGYPNMLNRRRYVTWFVPAAPEEGTRPHHLPLIGCGH